MLEKLKGCDDFEGTDWRVKYSRHGPKLINKTIRAVCKNIGDLILNNRGRDICCSINR